MTEYIHAATLEWPLSASQIMERHPSVSFPNPFNPAALGYFEVIPVDAPPFDPLTQSITEAPPQLLDGAWLQQWSVSALSDEDAAAAQVAYMAAVEADFVSRLEEMYDAKANERRYDTRYTCALRAGYSGPFQSEGISFAQWMDACNEYCYSLLAQVQAGTQPIPTWEQLVSELPEAPW